MTLLIGKNSSILFLHVPKCGGSSIVEMFSDNGYSPQLQIRGLPPQECLLASPQHQTCENLRAFIRLELLTDIFILVRNPYTRIKSEFNWIFRDTPTDHRPDFSQWILDSLALASEDRSYSDNHFRPAIDFMDTSAPAKIFRLEDGIEFAIEFFLHEHGAVRSIRVAHEKSALQFNNNSLNLSFSKEAIDAINNFYEHDFAAFGYSMTDEHGNPFQCNPLQARGSHDIHEKVNAVISWRANTLAMLKNKLTEQIRTLAFKLKNRGESLEILIKDKGTRYTTGSSLLELIYGDLLVRLSQAKAELERSILPAGEETCHETISAMLTIVNQYRGRLINVVCS